MSEDLRVLLIDDHAGDRALAGALLREALEQVQVREVEGALDFAQVLGHRSWNAAVAERDLAWGDGAEVLRTLKRRHPQCLTILFSRTGPEGIGAIGGSSGIDAYLHKESTGYLRLPELLREGRRRSPAGPPSEEHDGLRAGLGTLPAGYFLVLSDGTILRANQALAHLLGASEPGALLDRRLTECLVEPGQRERCERALLRGARESGAVMTLRADSGEEVALVLSFWPVPDPEGRACLEGLVWAPPFPDLPREGQRARAFPPPVATTEPAEAAPALAERPATAVRAALVAAVKHLEPAVSAAGARLRVGALPEIQVERSELTRLFRELIDNALRNRVDDTVEVSIRAEAQAGGWLISVEDNARGMDEEERRGLFESLETSPGSGLGICRSIARRYGGELWLVSRAGVGTTVFVSLKVPGNRDPRTPLAVRVNGRPAGRVWVRDAGDDREIARAALAIPSVRRDMGGRTIKSVERAEDGTIDIEA